jgi:hypothetical protein
MKTVASPVPAAVSSRWIRKLKLSFSEKIKAVGEILGV